MKESSISWFSSCYADEDKRRMMDALYPFVCMETDSGYSKKIRSALSVMLKSLINCNYQLPRQSISYEGGEKIACLLASMPVMQLQDFLVIALVLCFFNRDNYQKRLQLLISNWTDKFIVVDTVLDVLNAVNRGDIEIIKDDKYLGEGFQNKISRQNGVNSLGLLEYKKQMSMMQQGVAISSIEEKYSFLNDASQDTLGGCFCKMMRDSGFNLPGEPYGFAEFFLWHDLTHILSGNTTSFIGELAVNAFTAASSGRAKFEILIWGLLQFNLGFSLAVVAKPGFDELPKSGAIKNYCEALLSASNTTLDVLNWPLDELFSDLKLSLNEVRNKYNINLVS